MLWGLSMCRRKGLVSAGEGLAGSVGESVPQPLAGEMRASHGEHLSCLRMCGLVVDTGRGSPVDTIPFLRPHCQSPPHTNNNKKRREKT
jgi:hypothetical protein